MGAEEAGAGEADAEGAHRHEPPPQRRHAAATTLLPRGGGGHALRRLCEPDLGVHTYTASASRFIHGCIYVA